MNGSFVTICLAGTMLAFLAGQLQTEELNLDKTGATRWRTGSRFSKPQKTRAREGRLFRYGEGGFQATTIRLERYSFRLAITSESLKIPWIHC